MTAISTWCSLKRKKELLLNLLSPLPLFYVGGSCKGCGWVVLKARHVREYVSIFWKAACTIFFLQFQFEKETTP
jgi:hypothetical protein